MTRAEQKKETPILEKSVNATNENNASYAQANATATAASWKERVNTTTNGSKKQEAQVSESEEESKSNKSGSGSTNSAEDTKAKQDSGKGEQQGDGEEEVKWKLHRRMLFFAGKLFKYTAWFCSASFLYHFYLIRNKTKPEEGFMANDFFLTMALLFDNQVKDMSTMMTKPPVEKLLPDPPDFGPGMIWPKTLVLNMRGTLIHSEYQFGEGFRYTKRPGLNVFLGKVSRLYECVAFGNEESMTINEICEALDPKYQIFSG